MAFGILDCKKMEVVPGTGEQLISSPSSFARQLICAQPALLAPHS
jgi:hypothetical protein